MGKDKKGCFSVVFAALATFCAMPVASQATDGEYTVAGRIGTAKYDGQTVYLRHFESDERLDSAVVSGGKMVFCGRAAGARYSRVEVGNEFYCNLILEPGDITLDFDSLHCGRGTVLNDSAWQVEMAYERRDSVLKVIWNGVEARIAGAAEREKEAEKLAKDYYRDVFTAYFAGHEDDALGHVLLNSGFLRSMRDADQEAVLSRLGPWLRTTKIAKREIRRVEERAKLAEAYRLTGKGAMFKDVEGTGLDGRAVALSDYVGRGKDYVLLDFWASWCGPCKREIPYLARLSEKFKGRGLTVVGMFVADTRENFAKAVAAEGISWPQIFDSAKTARALYGVTGIPQIILFAPDGRIVARDLRGEQMVKLVEETLGSGRK